MLLSLLKKNLKSNGREANSTRMSQKSNLLLSFVVSLIVLYQLYISILLHDYSFSGLFLLMDVLLYLSLARLLNKDVLRRRVEKIRLFEPFIWGGMALFTLFLLNSYIRVEWGASMSASMLYLGVFSYLLFLFRSEIERFFSERLKIKVLFIASISLLLSFYMWGNNLHAQWGMVDDHMLTHYFIDNADGMSFSEIPRILMEKTEIGKFGHSTINRPVYYFGRVLESVLWQRNVTLWYFARILMFAVSVAGLWWLSQKRLGMLYGGIFTGALFLPAYWGWIWGYLGPSENYAMFGVVLFLLGFSSIIEKINMKNVQGSFLSASLLLLFGALIAIGAKENFLFLFLPTAYLGIILVKRGVRNTFLLLSLAVIFLYCAFITTGIYLGLSKAGGDVYGQSIQLSERLKITLDSFFLAWKAIGGTWIVFGLSAVGISLRFFRKRELFVDYGRLAKTFFISAFGLLLLYISQALFYNGNFPPSALRYSFPGMLTVPFFALLFLSTAFSVFNLLGLDRRIIRNMTKLLFVGLLIVIVVDDYRDSRSFVNSNVKATNEFAGELSEILAYLKIHPEQPVVIDSYSIWNVEPIASLHAYLLVDGIHNPIFLRLNYPPVTTKEPGHDIDRKIYDFLSYVSTTGECGFTGASWTFLSGGDCDQWSFSPFGDFHEESGYLSVKISESNNVDSEVRNPTLIQTNEKR